jgi:hypothetical protein
MGGPHLAAGWQQDPLAPRTLAATLASTITLAGRFDPGRNYTVRLAPAMRDKDG